MAGDAEMQMSVAAVIRHASTVDDTADKMETARGAAAYVQMGVEAYGQICVFLPRLIDPVADRTVTALGESATALREAAANLRAAAAATEATDAASAQRFTDRTGRLELPL
ncbi:type VII secretion target [Micromonospora sp. NPDC005252]|uniref:type VII secretion target n=1 Tax=Micromonospora sp. NPDC005252 TaxID=3364228 RepID=UPI0036AFBA87